MLKRFHVYLLWVWLFAWMQTGLVTHEISHLKELTQQSQPEKKTGTEPCTLCVAAAQSVGTLPTALVWAVPLSTAMAVCLPLLVLRMGEPLALYAARAPPLLFSI